jgi:hypothetical protein
MSETLTAEQKAERRRQYKLNYQREYYSKRKANPDFMDKRRETTKKHYNYQRKTIDCSHCRLRHKPDSDKCLLIVNAKRERMKQCILDSLETAVSPSSPPPEETQS